MNISKLQIFLIIGILLSPSIALSSQTVVAWGDSLTAGTGGTAWTIQFAELSGVTTLNRGVGGNTSTQIANRFFDEPALFDDFAVIWAGRNNYTDPSTVKSDVAAMVSSLSTQNYLILGLINGNYGGYESVGGTGYSLITGINSDLTATYGSRFIDIRNTLVTSYNPFSSQDISDFTRDIVPSSLRSDAIHLNTAGYSVVGNAVYAAYYPVPIPAAIWLFFSGLGLLSFTNRNKQLG